jgi:hypothetical protein
MAAIDQVEKQPSEIKWFDVSFADYMTNRGLTAASAVAVVDTGITLVSTTLISTAVRVRFSGGVDGSSYHCTVTMTMTDGSTSEYDFLVKVKEL